MYVLPDLLFFAFFLTLLFFLLSRDTGRDAKELSES